MKPGGGGKKTKKERNTKEENGSDVEKVPYFRVCRTHPNFNLKDFQKEIKKKKLKLN